MRPRGPVPWISVMSSPNSRAMRRTEGEAGTTRRADPASGSVRGDQTPWHSQAMPLAGNWHRGATTGLATAGEPGVAPGAATGAWALAGGGSPAGGAGSAAGGEGGSSVGALA